MNYQIGDLQKWDERIGKIIEEIGLDCYPQEFEICDQNDMLGYMAYTGLPSHYSHWSFGKAFERQKTLYKIGISGLPYEMVINSDPCLAYLMKDNTLLLSIGNPVPLILTVVPGSTATFGITSMLGFTKNAMLTGSSRANRGY